MWFAIALVFTGWWVCYSWFAFNGLCLIWRLQVGGFVVNGWMFTLLLFCVLLSVLCLCWVFLGFLVVGLVAVIFVFGFDYMFRWLWLCFGC